ncbi:MAG: DUF1049 domain-containing protein [Azorhizobium sp. 35-67-5]|nr:MAG: DUF1049 domain-containing protein [Azorhizobium sp. 35-67-5]
MARFLSLILGVPASILIVALAVANRRPVVLSLDPFSPDAPALAVTLPLFAVILGAVIFGLIIGGLVTWFRQGRYRREARQSRRGRDRTEETYAPQRPTGTALSAPIRR